MLRELKVLSVDVHIDRAFKMEQMDQWSHSNVFIVAHVAGSRRELQAMLTHHETTNTRKPESNANPVLNHRFSAAIASDRAWIRLEAYDWDETSLQPNRFGVSPDDKFIGAITMPLRMASDAGEHVIRAHVRRALSSRDWGV